MKKNLYIANLLVAGLMTFTGCTDGFESDNANKAGYTPELCLLYTSPSPRD